MRKKKNDTDAMKQACCQRRDELQGYYYTRVGDTVHQQSGPERLQLL